MATAQDKLKDIQEKKKALSDEQSQLRKQLEASKDATRECRKEMADVRVQIKALKPGIKNLLALTNVTLSKGSTTDIEVLSDDLESNCEKLIEEVRRFQKAKETMDSASKVEETESEDNEV